MSNSQAIAAVTATLQSILQQGITADTDLNDTTVTIQPLDKARGGNSANQLNLFLYMVSRSAAWVNADMPRQVQPGESAVPPLPLNLYYLITSFGRDDDVSQPYGHELLGKAMSVLHDHPLLSGDDIRAATQALLPGNDLAQQLERIRITLHPLSIDELSKLWTGFAMQYRLSAAYEVAVTLIESTRATRAPVPALTRGKDDQGIRAQADTAAQLPTLLAITPPNRQASALLKDLVTLSGAMLDGSNVGVQFNHPLWAQPLELAPQPGAGATSLTVQIPDQPTLWPAGFYTVAVLVQKPGEDFRRVTNQLTLALAPVLSLAPGTTAAGNVNYTATVSPQVWPEQKVSLMLGSRELLPAAHPAMTPTLAFAADNLEKGEYWIRLRVDGVDSLLVDRSKSPPVFNNGQKVKLT